jgi:hypothetical protein
MKRQLTLFVILGLLASGSLAKADLLSNGNLDAASVSGQVLPTPTGWIASANRTSTGAFNDGMSSEGFANVLAPGGNGLFFKPFQGEATTNRITASLYQDNPGTPGLSYTLTGWAGAGTSYIGLTDATVKSQFQLTFLNGVNTVVGGVILDLVAAGLGTGAPTPPATGFGYHPFSLSAIAPVGTVTVRAEAIMIDAYNNPAGGDQAFVVDAFTLVPEPSIISLAMLGLTGVLAFRRRR